MKVAFVTEDGKTICRHFGRAPYYLVVELDGKNVVSKRMVPKGGCANRSRHDHEEHGGVHLGSEERHKSMIQQADGCEIVVSGGMGMGAYQSLMLSGIEVYITNVEDIDEAISLLAENRLDNNLELLH
ncbi:MAG: NifB/NifX family molybdenum-iron cluster-binding protein [Candidatus Verstraetearchaeota archaeon]|nr:NifB/NifX family molybdenum-iron cluster-binding protein [Candidatus Verstraetearchaeota archaeon]